MEESPATLIALAGFVLGLAFGATVHRTHFCTMGAIADIALFGDWRRMRSWLLAIAVALLGSQTLQLAGLVDLSRSVYVASEWPWLLAIAGGLLFGFGMTQTGGCASRTVVRLGAGNLKSLLVLAVMGAAIATTGLVLGTLGSWPAGASGSAPAARGPFADALLAAVLGGCLLVFCLRDRAFRAAQREFTAGLAVGGIAMLAWLVTATPGAGEAAPAALNFVLPVAAGGLHLPGAGAPAAAFGLALIAGTAAGAFAAARASGTFRIERFTSASDLRRHAIGALLMGVGGGLALGCTIGHGISGIAALAPASFLCLLAIVAGGVAGVRYLEQGSLKGAMRALLAGG